MNRNLEWEDDYDENIVSCDEGCGALKSPATLEEALKSLEHYKSHGWLSGCSHGS